ncbi:hypothetical protein PG999_001448 [Apiospora kogelbergensis]|uniref:Uncharacterized protein n=1 Tax=Apiospora kogelbergensis TaxID=1337665 RepID=A0AAW0REC7_9PEZI
MCYHPETVWSCGCRETASSNLERCGGAIAYGLNCIGTMPAPAHRTLHVAIPCPDCRSKRKPASSSGEGSHKGVRALMTACF